MARLLAGLLTGLLTSVLATGCGVQTPAPARGAAGAIPIAGLPSATVQPAAGVRRVEPRGVPRAKPAAAAPKGSTLVTDPANGFSVMLPPGYTRLTDVADFDRALTRSKNPLHLSPAQVTEYRDLIQRGLLVFGVDFATGRSASLMALPAGGQRADSLPAQIPAIKAQLTAVHATKIQITRTTVGGRPGLRVSAALTTAKGTVSSVQLYTIANDKVYVLTVSGKPLRAADVALLTRTLTFTQPTI